MEHCQDCGIKLKGRTDKRFCNDYCRGHYHNVLNKDRHELLKKINNILRKNAGILRKLNMHGVHEVTRSILISSGFNFTFFTHQLYIAGTDEIYNCCYSYGYYAVTEDKYVLKDISTCLRI